MATPDAPTLGFNDPRGLIPYIRETAQKYGIDPDTAVRVAASEGLNSFKSSIPGENSFGAFQLYTGGGMGNDFQRATGLDPSDPKNEQAGIDYALKQASLHGWGPFHGAKNMGIGPWQGITVGSPPVGAPLSAPQMAQGSPSVPMASPAAQNQNASPQPSPLQGGGQGVATGQAAPLNAPTPPPAQPFMQPQPFRPQINMGHLQNIMAAYPQLRGLLPLFTG